MHHRSLRVTPDAVLHQTRATYKRQCEQHKSDIASLQALGKLADGQGDLATTSERIAAAQERKPANPA